METLDLIPGTTLKIYQSDEVFKYSIDSIILSSFAKLEKGKTLIDLGMGQGIMLFRCKALYDLGPSYGIEIQEKAYQLAKKTKDLNQLEDLHLLHKDMRDLNLEIKVDSIITNPPYVECGRGIKNLSQAKNIAFTEEKMTLDDIFSFSAKHLKEKGRLFMINRANRLVDIMSKARAYKLEPVRMRTVHSFSEKDAKFIMLEFKFRAGSNFSLEAPLIIYERPGQYTDEIKEMYYGRS